MVHSGIQFIIPGLMLPVVVVLICLYCHFKNKKVSRVTPTSTQADSTPSGLNTMTLPEDWPVRTGPVLRWGHENRTPPRYSTVEHPPPYSLFDPKQTVVGARQEHPPPEYEVYPIMLPLASRQWMTPTSSSF